jgi:serine/threonine-protein kinase
VLVAGRYRLEGRIAAGGAGEVWKGTEDVLGRSVAVKLLRAEYAQHPQAVARFRAEARHASALSHPGIAQVYGYGEAGAPYLVMELVDGPSLAHVLEAGPLDPGRVMDVVAQAAAGLQAAYRAGLVHRDIKPGNLLLGRGGQVKITDFGICHAAGSAPLTGTGTLLGTPAYLAPERVAGRAATPGQRPVFPGRGRLGVPGRRAAIYRGPGRGRHRAPGPPAAATARPGPGRRGRACGRADRQGPAGPAGPARRPGLAAGLRA